MRNIGTLDNKLHAERISAYLYIKGIPNELGKPDNLIEQGSDQWILWVHSDDQLEEACALFERFLEDPDDSIYNQAIKASLQQRAKALKERARSRVQYVDVRTRWSLGPFRGMGRLTLAFITISAIVAIASKLGESREILRHISIADYEVSGGFIRWRPGLAEIQEGQVWRLFTPIFIHFGLLHLLFNMLWLKDLGSFIEHRLGWLKFLAFALVVGGLSNLGQYWVSGPTFGGMSGVVYGMLGFIWIRGKLDPSSGYYLNPTIALMMGAWFVICLFGLVGNIANTAHGVGLGLGLALGFIASGRLGILKKGR